MGTLGIITCDEQDQRRLFFKRIFKKRLFSSGCKRIKCHEAYNGSDVKIAIFKLPFCSKEINSMISLKGIEEFLKTVRDIQNKYQVQKIILDQRVVVTGYPELSPLKNNIGLYDALIPDIIQSFSQKNGIEIKKVCITIISGENISRLIDFAAYMATFVRFINILTSKEKLQNIDGKIESIFDSTGLSVRVSSNCRSCIKESDYVIDLGETDKLISMTINNNRKYVPNLNKSIGDRLVKNIIVSGVRFSCPEYIKNKIPSDLMINDNKFVEAYLALRLNIIYDKNQGGVEALINTRKSFYNEGFGIAAIY